MRKFAAAGLLVAACIGVTGIAGCGGGGAPVTPQAENPNPDLQPAGRSAPGGGGTESGTSSALGGEMR